MRRSAPPSGSAGPLIAPKGSAADGLAGLALDPSVVVLPAPRAEAGGPSFILRSPAAFTEVVATLEELEVVHALEAGVSAEALLEEAGPEAPALERFLRRCAWAGMLRPTDGFGRARPPLRVPAAGRFFGAPLLDPEAPPDFAVLGVPFDGHATGRPGARFGPSALRAATEGVRYALDALTQVPLGFFDFASGQALLPGSTLADAGDVLVAVGEDPVELFDRVTAATRELLDLGAVPLLVGGDHSLTAPALAAFPEEPLQVVHLDAHADLGPLERDDGTGVHHANVFTAALEALPHLVHLRQLGLRGVVDGRARLEHPRVRAVGMDVLRGEGCEAALAGLDPELPTYVSIDVDVVDPAFAPSTGTPVPGGLWPHELKACLRAIGRRLRVVGADLMEVTQPLGGGGDGTAALAAEALLVLADALQTRRLRGPAARARGAARGAG